MSFIVKRGPIAADNFTIVSNKLIRDSRLSLKARGLACWLLSHRDDFSLTVTRIAQLNECGTDQVSRALAELESLGYLVREQGKDPETGQFEKMIYYVSDLQAEGETAGHARYRVSPTRETPTRETRAHKKTTSKKITKREDENLPAAVADGGQISLLPKPQERQDGKESPQKAINRRAVAIAQRHYERMGKLGNVAAWTAIAKAAITRTSYSDAQIDAAFEEIHRHNLSVTEERLANTLRGGPQFGKPKPPERVKHYQIGPNGRRGQEIEGW
jgi:Helix-turn-helix domain